MYRTRNFTINELVHPWILRDIGEENAWRRLDADALLDIDFIRDEWFGLHGTGIYCNQGANDSRGLRPPNDPDGSKYSTHKQGNTFDLVPINGKHQEFWSFVETYMRNGRLKKLNTMEDRSFTPTWTHCGYMNHGEGNILIIRP